MNEEQYAKILADLAANQKEHESYNRRLKEHDEKLERQAEILIVLERLTQTVKGLTDRMGEINTSFKALDSRLEDIEKEPGDNWKRITFEVLKWAVIGILAFAAGAAFSTLKGA